MTRREFVAISGSAAGLLALSSMGLSEGLVENISEINAGTLKHRIIKTDVLVIGGGMAGLFAAVKANDAGAKTVIVSKGRLGSSGQTPFAKGIFVYNENNESMSVDQFVNAVAKSAGNSNNKAYTKQLALHSAERVKELSEWGFFESSLYNKSFMNPIELRNIPLYERITITHLIKENGKIAGAAGFSLEDENIYIFNAKSIILCTGAGGFKPSGFPICDLTHDGSVMAYNIGAMITGKEWNDGHLAQAENPAACYDGWHGMFERKPETTGIEIRHDLGVDLNYQAYNNGAPIKMQPPKQRGDEGVGGEKRGERRPQKPPRIEGERGDGPPGMMGSVTGGSSAGLSIHKSEGLTPMN
ncbi:MAG: FAD-binding protein, partial [Melioribacteraceae bacterium]